MKILMIGAHPDDNDFRSGGTALKYIKKGHSVRFLSICDGSGGHYELSPEQIRERRLGEFKAVTALTGIEYETLGIPDCELMADLPTRKKLVNYIRKYAPDIIFTHRNNDYHADHRNAALLVQDASYLLGVPNFCPETKAIKTPLIMYFYDKFKNPEFAADVVVATDDVIDEKYKMFDCHVSQVYEWLPYENGVLSEVPKDPKKRLEWLRNPRVPRDGTFLTEKDMDIFIASNNSEYREALPAIKYRNKLIERYGEDGKNFLFAEAFSVSEYGARLTKENLNLYFPF